MSTEFTPKKVCTPANAPNSVSPATTIKGRLNLLTPTAPKATVVVARVCELEDTRVVQARGQSTQVRNCVLRDERGEMPATFWGNSGDHLEDGKVFEFSRFQVQFNSNPRNGSKSRYSLSFSGTEISPNPCARQVADEGSISTGSAIHWTSMTAVKSARQYAQVDLICVLTQVSDAATRDTKNGPAMFREVNVLDETSMTTKCAIWGPLAEKNVYAVGSVVGLTKLTVRDYQGGKSLSMRPNGEVIVFTGGEAMGHAVDSQALAAHPSVKERVQLLIETAKNREDWVGAVDLNVISGTRNGPSMFDQHPTVTLPQLTERMKSFASPTPESYVVREVKLSAVRQTKRAAEAGQADQFRACTYLACQAPIERMTQSGPWKTTCNKKCDERSMCPEHGVESKAQFKFMGFTQVMDQHGASWFTMDANAAARFMPQLDVQRLGQLEAKAQAATEEAVRDELIQEITAMLNKAKIGPEMDVVFQMKERPPMPNSTQALQQSTEVRPRLTLRCNAEEKAMEHWKYMQNLMVA